MRVGDLGAVLTLVRCLCEEGLCSQAAANVHLSWPSHSRPLNFAGFACSVDSALRRGQIVYSGSASALRDSDVFSSYLGTN